MARYSGATDQKKWRQKKIGGMMIKVLNLYAGIGGNRKLWTDVDVTAVELNQTTAKVYQGFFPKDVVIVEDAHKFLLRNYKDFDFIWSSPPCQTHSDWRRLWVNAGNYKPLYPDMRLYQEILFLKHFFKGKWVVENVMSYYEPLIKPQVSGSHYFWSNFIISNIEIEARGSREDRHFLEKRKGFVLDEQVKDKRQLLRNCVEPELGQHIFKCAYKTIQMTIKADDGNT